MVSFTRYLGLPDRRNVFFIFSLLFNTGSFWSCLILICVWFIHPPAAQTCSWRHGKPLMQTLTCQYTHHIQAAFIHITIKKKTSSFSGKPTWNASKPLGPTQGRRCDSSWRLCPNASLLSSKDTRIMTGPPQTDVSSGSGDAAEHVQDRSLATDQVIQQITAERIYHKVKVCHGFH